MKNNRVNYEIIEEIEEENQRNPAILVKVHGETEEEKEGRRENKKKTINSVSFQENDDNFECFSNNFKSFLNFYLSYF